MSDGLKDATPTSPEETIDGVVYNIKTTYEEERQRYDGNFFIKHSDGRMRKSSPKDSYITVACHNCYFGRNAVEHFQYYSEGFVGVKDKDTCEICGEAIDLRHGEQLADHIFENGPVAKEEALKWKMEQF